MVDPEDRTSHLSNRMKEPMDRHLWRQVGSRFESSPETEEATKVQSFDRIALVNEIYFERGSIGRPALTVVPWGVEDTSNVPPNLRTRSFMPGIPTPYLLGI
jgi:hypothetical protein